MFSSLWVEVRLEIPRGLPKKGLEIVPGEKRVFPGMILFQNSQPTRKTGASCKDFLVVLDFVPVAYKFILGAVSKQQLRIHIFLVCL